MLRSANVLIADSARLSPEPSASAAPRRLPIRVTGRSGVSGASCSATGRRARRHPRLHHADRTARPRRHGRDPGLRAHRPPVGTGSCLENDERAAHNVCVKRESRRFLSWRPGARSVRPPAAPRPARGASLPAPSGRDCRARLRGLRRSARAGHRERQRCDGGNRPVGDGSAAGPGLWGIGGRGGCRKRPPRREG